MMRRKAKTAKKKVKEKLIGPGGIEMKSSLEVYCGNALKDAGIEYGYETEKFMLLEGFEPSNRVFTRQSNGKAGTYKERTGTKVRAITYRPDFIGADFIIETKGYNRPTDVLKYKMFMQTLQATGDTRIYIRPQNRKEVDEAVKLLKTL